MTWSRSGRRPLVEFLLIGLLTVALVGVAGVVASRRAGEDEAINEVRQLTQTLASTVVAAAAADGLLDGDPAAVARMDAALAAPLAESGLLRVKVWTRDGRIVYSDDHRLLGSVYELDRDQQAAIAQDGVIAEISHLDRPENRFEADQDQLLEVYTAVSGPDGDRLLFEAYYDYATVGEAAARLWWTFVPIVLGCLLATEAVHLGLAGRLVRRLRASQEERQRLLEQAIGASDAERRRIAADLHDGVVQELAGLALGLSTAAAIAGRGPDRELARCLDTASADARHSVHALRTLAVDIYPADLDQSGLEAALVDLLAPLSEGGIQTRLVVDVPPVMTPDTRRIVYRVAQEAVRNATRHGAPSAVSISVTAGGVDVVTEVADDGRGFDVQAASTARGHLGLSVLRDLAASARGDLAIRSAPGAGTTVTMRVPA